MREDRIRIYTKDDSDESVCMGEYLPAMRETYEGMDSFE
jgi:hypothetical protein